MADMTDDDAVTGPTASRGAVSVMLLGASDLTGELASAFRHLGADVATVPGYSDTAELTALIEAYRTDLAMTRAQDEARRKLDEKIAAMDAKGEQTTAHPSLLPVETEAAIAADAIKRIEASPDHVVKLGRMTVPVYKASKVTYFVADFGVSVTDLDQASHYYDGQYAARLRDQIIATMHVAAENQLMRGDDVDSEKLAARVAEDLRAKFAGVEDFLFLSLYKTDVPRG